jgi:hypothetical protein
MAAEVIDMSAAVALRQAQGRRLEKEAQGQQGVNGQLVVNGQGIATDERPDARFIQTAASAMLIGI